MGIAAYNNIIFMFIEPDSIEILYYLARSRAS